MGRRPWSAGEILAWGVSPRVHFRTPSLRAAGFEDEDEDDDEDDFGAPGER